MATEKWLLDLIFSDLPAEILLSISLCRNT